MGRRPLGLGQHGKITVKPDVQSGMHVARCRVRDGDGVSRQVQAQAASKSAAKNALVKALTLRGARRGTRLINSTTRLSALAEIVFNDLDERVRLKAASTQTVRRYRQAWRAHIQPAMGERTLGEITVFECDQFIFDVRHRTSTSNTKVVRAAFSKILSYAAKGEGSAFPYGNPFRDIEPIAKERRRRQDPDSLEPDAVRELLEALRADPIAVDRELDYMVMWMVCTGDRIGNMLAGDWSYIDLMDGLAHLQGVAIEHNGVMSLEFGSSKSNDRNVDLPSQLITILRTLWFARGCPESGLIFPGKRGNPRGLSHLHDSFRDAFVRAGFTGLKPHSFRRTTATELMRAGLSDHQIAAYLGHDDVETTRRHYLRKRQESPLRLVTLDNLARGDDPRRAAGGP